MEIASKEAQQLHEISKVHQVSGDRKSGQDPCFRCGQTGHLAATRWCKDMHCRHCGKKGHVDCACRNKKSTVWEKERCWKIQEKRHVHAVEQGSKATTDSSEEEVRVNFLKVLNMDEGSDGYWTTPELEGHPLKMQIDTGSRASIISFRVYRKFLFCNSCFGKAQRG